jgi:hypothetical protein
VVTSDRAQVAPPGEARSAKPYLPLGRGELSRLREALSPSSRRLWGSPEVVAIPEHSVVFHHLGGPAEVDCSQPPWVDRSQVVHQDGDAPVPSGENRVPGIK